MEAEQLHRSANPNICPSCEQLLEDDSPALMAEIAQLESRNEADELLDQPSSASPPQPEPAEAPKAKQSQKR